MEGSSSGEGPLGASRHALDQSLVELMQATRLGGEASPDVDAVLRRLLDGARDVVAADEAEFIPASGGEPASEPPGCVVVPVEVSGERFGALRVCRGDGTELDEIDRKLLATLAVTGGVAVENARLFEQERRRREWLAMAAEVTRTVLAEPRLEPLDLIVSRVLELACADLVAIVAAEDRGERLRVAAAAGTNAEGLRGSSCLAEHTMTGIVLQRGEIFRSPHADLTGYDERTTLLGGFLDVGPAVAVPLAGPHGRPAVLWAVRAAGRTPFTELDASMVLSFGEQVSVAWQVADAREAQVRAELIGDRSRIARDLHDHVIQRLFAAGLTLHAVAPRAGDVGDRIGEVVEELDAVIKQIRSSIFELTPPADGLRAAAMHVVDDVAASLGFEPHVAFDGPVDTRGAGELVNDVTAVLREALTNVAKHAGATAADVLVRADADALEVRVTDNGRGLTNPTRSSGLRNLRERAEARSGSLRVEPCPAGHGTSVAWRVPVPRRETTP